MIDEAAILASRLAHTGVTLYSTYAWLFRHGYSLADVKTTEPLDIATCIDNDWPLSRLNEWPEGMKQHTATMLTKVAREIGVDDDTTDRKLREWELK